MYSFGNSKLKQIFQPSWHQCSCTDLDIELVRLVQLCRKFMQLTGVVPFPLQRKLNAVPVLT